MKITIGKNITLASALQQKYSAAAKSYKGQPGLADTRLRVRVFKGHNIVGATTGALSAPANCRTVLTEELVYVFALDDKETATIELTLILPCVKTTWLVKKSLGTTEYTMQTTVAIDKELKNKRLDGKQFNVIFSAERYATELAAAEAAVVLGCRSIRGGTDGAVFVDVAPIHALVGMFAPAVDYLALVDQDNVDTKLANLKNRLSQTKGTFFDPYADAIEQAGKTCVKIFMVPEYYFRNNGWNATPTSLTETQRDAIITALEALSGEAAYEDVLIVAGTILFHSDGDQGVNVAKGDNINQVDGHLDDTESKQGRLVKNVAPILYAGSLLTECRKHRDQKELPDAERATYQYEYLVPTGATVCRFEIPDTGVLCGAEICQDHTTGRLKAVMGNTRDRHIQFVISAGALVKHASTVTRKNGVVFRCDGGAIACNRPRAPMPVQQRQDFLHGAVAVTKRVGHASPFAIRVKLVDKVVERTAVQEVQLEAIKPVAMIGDKDLIWFEAELPSSA